jgi:acyl carrier protein phosphodiesterase
MNFFGHAVVATLEHDAPCFVLGAMLPDLCSMAGLQLKGCDHAVIAAGIAQHHRVDRAFHGCAPFVAACSSALSTLEAQGVTRASARAVGHVGSELILDGALAHRAHARRAYQAALAVACEPGTLDALSFRDDARRRVLLTVAERLATAPIPEAYREPAFVHDRLSTILARRPRLALASSDHDKVRAWLELTAERLAPEADAIVTLLDAARAEPLP